MVSDCRYPAAIRELTSYPGRTMRSVFVLIDRRGEGWATT